MLKKAKKYHRQLRISKTIFFIFNLVTLFYSCKKQESVIFFISNESSFERKVDLKVMMDDSIVISNTFEYSDITPNFTKYEMSMRKKNYVLSIYSSSGIIRKIDSLGLFDKKYIYINYVSSDPSLKTYDIDTVKKTEIKKIGVFISNEQKSLH